MELQNFALELKVDIISSSTSQIGVPWTISSYDVNSMLHKVFEDQINLGNSMLNKISQMCLL